MHECVRVQSYACLLSFHASRLQHKGLRALLEVRLCEACNSVKGFRIQGFMNVIRATA